MGTTKNTYEAVALDVIKRLARNNDYLTSDEVQDALSRRRNPTPKARPGALGRAFRTAASEGIIYNAGFSVTSRRRPNHNRRIAVWYGY